MVKFKTVKNLYIDEARYLVHGTNGERVSININYLRGTYRIVGKPKKDLLEDLQFFAKDLIERKSRVNFA